MKKINSHNKHEISLNRILLFAQWLLKLGYEKVLSGPQSGLIQLQELIYKIEDIKNNVFPNIEENYKNV